MVTTQVRLRQFSILVLLTVALAGCQSDHGISMLHPHGLVADAQRRWLADILLVMAVVVLPVLVLVPWFAWRYRRGNSKVAYKPDWSFSWPIEFVVWGVPALIVVALAALIIVRQATLDPYDRLKSVSQPLEVQVVALDWKFLFIYPEQGIATVGMLAIPEGRPVEFHLTSDSTMQSFFIPALGSQIYAMAGMVTQLHLVADTPGSVMGENTQFNGDHFQDEKFTVDVLPKAGFEEWVVRQKAEGLPFDAQVLKTLATPGTVGKAKQSFGVQDRATLSFKDVGSDVFATIVDKYNPGAMHMAGPTGPMTGSMRGMR